MYQAAIQINLGEGETAFSPSLTLLWPKRVFLGSTFVSTLESAITDFVENTCIRLVPRIDEERYIKFYDGGVCKSPVGAVSEVVMVRGAGRSCPR